MKKVIYALGFALVIVTGFVYASRENKTEPSPKPAATPLTAAQMKDERERWLGTADGIKFKQWEESPAGKKVYAAEAKIWKHIMDSSNMHAVVTSLSLPPGSRVGFGVMATINGEDFIVTFDAEKSQLDLLKSLQVNDKIIIRSRHVSHAPKYAYPILSGDYVEKDGKVIFKRIPRTGGC